jgi:hypothetical protein
MGDRSWPASQLPRVVPDQPVTEEQIKRLIGRGAVIGAAMDAWMLAPGWVRGKSRPEEMGVTMATVVDHIDRVCQLAGNCRHAALGTDLDGGFGREQSPADLDTIADLQRTGTGSSGLTRGDRGIRTATGCGSVTPGRDNAECRYSVLSTQYSCS